MAKAAEHGLRTTPGTFQMAGIVSGTNKPSFYTEKTEIPQYQPTGENVSLSDCFDDDKYKELLEHKNLVTRRLLKAFPNMISRNQNEMLQKYKEYLTSRKNN